VSETVALKNKRARPSAGEVRQFTQEYTPLKDSGKRYIGLDVHKHYLLALGVDEDWKVVLPARGMELSHLESWMKQTLTRQDNGVLEMTTNTWQLYDELCVSAGSGLVVHPPHVALITRSQHRSWRAYWRRDCWWECGYHPRKFVNCVAW